MSSAGVVLADWGADVVEIENLVTGDAQRDSSPSLVAPPPHRGLFLSHRRSSTW
ncbi:CoA transferase [Mycobacterium avium subsp. hominissuis]|nr:CoA transferase [Mycobacterium avium subsp. hominissuis]